MKNNLKSKYVNISYLAMFPFYHNYDLPLRFRVPKCHRSLYLFIYHTGPIGEQGEAGKDGAPFKQDGIFNKGNAMSI